MVRFVDAGHRRDGEAAAPTVGWLRYAAGAMTPILAIHLAATWFMTGLIWLVQVVQYPLFARVGPEAFPAYHAGHAALITLVVGPAMLVEAATAGWLVLTLGSGPRGWVWWVAAGLLAVIWASTAFLQVPAHGVLAQGFDAEVHRRLVDTNWIRTVGWTARALLVSAWVAGAFKA